MRSPPLAHASGGSRKQQRNLRARTRACTVESMEPETYDVIVVGGGAAGLSAALVLGRARRRVAVVDSGEPRNAPAAQMHGFLSRDGMPPADLLDAGRNEVTRYGVELIDDRVVAIEAGFSAGLASGARLQGRRILVATGAHDELPDIPGDPRALGPRFPALPVLPRLGGARPGDRRPRDRPWLRRPRPAASAVVGRRRLLPAHVCPSPRTSAWR